MSGKSYLNSIINNSIKEISKKLNEYKYQKPWKFQKYVNKIKKDISEDTRSISTKTIKYKKRTSSKNINKSLKRTCQKRLIISEIKEKSKKIDKKKKEKKKHEVIKDNSIPNSTKDKSEDKEKSPRKLKRKSLLEDKLDEDKTLQNLNIKKESKKISKHEKIRKIDSYRCNLNDIISIDENNNNIDDIEKSEQKKRREKYFNKKQDLKSPKINLCIDGKDPDEEFYQKIKKLDIPLPDKKKEGSEERRLNIEELALNYATKNPRSQVSSKLMGPYEIETIEDARKKHPNVKIIDNKNFNGRVMNDIKRPFWHQIDPIPLLLGKQEDPTDDTLPINTDMLKSYEQGKLKVDNNINLKPNKPNPFGALRDMINQNPMFAGSQIFGNTMRNIVKFRPKHLRNNNSGRVDSIMILETTPSQDQINKIKEVKCKPLPFNDDNTAEEELESSLKKLQNIQEKNIFPVLPKTKIIYKRINPCIWKEVSLYKKNPKSF